MHALALTDRFARVRELAPGMTISLVVAAAATFLAEHYGAPRAAVCPAARHGAELPQR